MEQAEAARHIGETLVAQLDYVGILGVELFDTAEGLIINEIAPRVHNSGHVTADTCAVGQFEQHIRAITGWPLGATDMHSQGEMTNILGHEIDNWAEFAGTPTHACIYTANRKRARDVKWGTSPAWRPFRGMKKTFKLNVFYNAAAPVCPTSRKTAFCRHLQPAISPWPFQTA